MGDDDSMTMGERIKYKLGVMGKSQKWLAEHTGVTQATISRVINDERSARVSVIVKIAKALGTTTDYIIQGEDGEEMCEFATPEAHAIHFLQTQFFCDDCRANCGTDCDIAVAINALNYYMEYRKGASGS